MTTNTNNTNNTSTNNTNETTTETKVTLDGRTVYTLDMLPVLDSVVGYSARMAALFAPDCDWYDDADVEE